MSLVVELEEGGAVGVVVLQVDVVYLRLWGGVAAVLADVHLKRLGILEISLQIFSSLRLQQSQAKRRLQHLWLFMEELPNTESCTYIVELQSS